MLSTFTATICPAGPGSPVSGESPPAVLDDALGVGEVVGCDVALLPQPPTPISASAKAAATGAANLRRGKFGIPRPPPAPASL